ncbi:MAG TPA: DUF1648 domain-containing protein [Pyrinomonadaceae bacterium]|nr:DUF1648 domain-containing protein [Pyrinomonadaceae bacterium]
MRDDVSAAIGLLVAEVLVLAVFLWMPVMRGERAFFGARVDAETYRGEGRRALRRYRQTLCGVFVLAGALGYYASVSLGKPVFSALATLGTTAAAFLVYGLYARQMRPFALSGGGTRFASSVRARRLCDFTLPWVEALVVLLTLASFAVLAHFYPRLPEMIPTHWNAAGEADDWWRKTLASVFFLPALGVYLQVLFFVLKRDLVQAKMTLPATNTEEYLRGKERFLTANMRLVDLARAGIATIFFAIAWLPVCTSLPEFKRYEAVAFAAVLSTAGLLVAGMGYFLWRMVVINRGLDELTGEEYVQRPEEEEHWRHGGLTYYNPEDPALVVEKLTGLGYTLNMGNPAVRYRLALMLGIPLFVFWALFNL